MRNRVCTAAFAAVLAVAGLTAPSASSALAQAGAPASVRALAPFEQNGSVVLRWTNPRALDRDVVRIVRGPDAPATVHDGRSVKLGSPRASKAVLGRLPAGRQFSVSVWTHRGSSLSRRVTTSFTTKPVEGRRTSELAGQVVDTAGNPLRNALVFAFDFTTLQRLLRTRTDASGKFQLLVSPGHYELAIIGARALGGVSDATGYLISTRRTTVRPGNVRSGLHFVLARAAAIRGSVTDSQNKPAAGVRVEPNVAPAYLGNDSGVLIGGIGQFATGRSDQSGHYVVKGLFPGTDVPCFQADGFGSRCATTSVAVRAGQVAAAPVVSLDRVAPTADGTIAGTVVDAASHPVSHAIVFASEGSSGAGFEVHTNRQGRFTLNNLAVGTWHVCAESVAAGGGGFGGDTCRTINVVANRTKTVELRLPPVGALSGLVRGPSGRRLGSVSISVTHQTAHGGWTYTTSSDLNGAWTVSGLHAGAFTVCISAEGASSAADPLGGRSTCLHRVFTVVAGTDRIGVDRTLAPGGAVSGTITDTTGRPVANAGVVFLRRGNRPTGSTVTTSGRDGQFRMTGLTPGSYRVCGELDYASGSVTGSCLAHRVTVVAGKVTRGAHIKLPQATLLTVTVKDGAGHALSGVDVAVLRACLFNDCPTQPVFSTTTPVDTAASQTTGLSGRAVFQGLRPGHYVACALAYYAASSAPVPASGFADKCASGTFSLTIRRGQPAAALVSLDPGAAATGLVQDSHGNPLRGVAVHIGRSAAFDYRNEFEFDDPSFPSPRNDIRTDATGHYIIRSIMPGTRSVCGASSRRLGVRRTCLSSPASLTASSTTQEPTLVMNSAMHAQRLSSAPPETRQTIPTAPSLPENRRIPVINSTGWPEFRLLPRSKP